MYQTYLAMLGNKSMSVYEMNFKTHKTNCVFSCLIFEYLWQCFFFPTAKAYLHADNTLSLQYIERLYRGSVLYLLN